MRLTNGCLTKLLISNLIGNVSPHQHTHGDTELLLDHVRDEFKSIRPLVYTLTEQKHKHKQRIYITPYQAGIWVKDHTVLTGLQLLAPESEVQHEIAKVKKENYSRVKP